MLPLWTVPCRISYSLIKKLLLSVVIIKLLLSVVIIKLLLLFLNNNKIKDKHKQQTTIIILK